MKYKIIKIYNKNKEVVAKTTVDECNFTRLSKYNWHLSNGYAENNKDEFMHRILLPNCPKGYCRDHINRNRLDNRMCNLRIISVRDNAVNMSGKGVSFEKQTNKWEAYLWINYKKIRLGRFVKKSDALKVRHQAKLKVLNSIK